MRMGANITYMPNEFAERMFSINEEERAFTLKRGAFAINNVQFDIVSYNLDNNFEGISALSSLNNTSGLGDITYYVPSGVRELVGRLAITATRRFGKRANEKNREDAISWVLSDSKYRLTMVEERVKTREEELGRKEHIVVIVGEGGGKPWKVFKNADTPHGAPIQELINHIISTSKQQGKPIDRIIIAACNVGRQEVTTQEPGIIINYIKGMMTSTKVAPFSDLFEFDSDTQSLTKITEDKYRAKNF